MIFSNISENFLLFKEFAEDEIEEEPEKIPETPIKKQNCSEILSKPEETKPKINIFETNIDSISTRPPEESKLPQKIANTDIELENMTKKLIPDYNFDTFGSKELKKETEKSPKNTNSRVFKSENPDPDSSENEEMVKDEQCRAFSLEITHTARNLLTRTAEQEQNRRKLPIYMKETEIIDFINNNFITIICGETGSGILSF